MAKVYRAHNGAEYNVSNMTREEQNILVWMTEEYERAESWATFHQRTVHDVIKFAKEKIIDWRDHTLYRIELDLARNVGIRRGELKGELSDMFIGVD